MKRLVLVLLSAVLTLAVVAPVASSARTDYRPWKRAMVSYWHENHVTDKRPHIAVRANVWGSAAKTMAQRVEAWSRQRSHVVVVCDGNSRTYGNGATHGVDDYPAQLAGLLPKAWTVVNAGVGGSDIAGMKARAAATDALLEPSATENILIVWEACNQYTTHRFDSPAYPHEGAEPAPTIHDNLAAYCLARQAAGWQVIVCTEITAQSEATRPEFDAFRYALNTLIRAKWRTSADAMLDLAADRRIGTLTMADAAADAVYFYDGTHLAPSGYGVVAKLAAAKLRNFPVAVSGRLDSELRGILRPYLVYR